MANRRSAEKEQAVPQDPTTLFSSSSSFASSVDSSSCDASSSSDLGGSSFEALSSDFVKHYGRTMANLQARHEYRKQEDALFSDEELAQAAFAWLWERIYRGEAIQSVRGLFEKSCLVSQRTKAIRRARRDWLLKQRTRIMSGDGSFAPPSDGAESEIGVGRSLSAREDTLQERAREVSAALEALRGARLMLRHKEREALDALCSGLDGKEAAEILGVTENNYRQRVFRLRRKLKKLLPKE